ncbi:BORE1 protein, partial [Rhinopomastus cyanomelas]|nr:BORE1 protein [Rhinopomastus cyanomelas]
LLVRGGSKKLLEEAATVDLGMSKIDRLTAEVIQTPLKVVKKAVKSKQCIEAIGEEAEPPLAKKAKHMGQCPVEPEAENSIQRTGKVGASTKKKQSSRSKRPPSAAAKRLSKRSSKSSFITPATGRSVDFCARGGTAMVTPRFDSRVFKTPGLRTPSANEHVYTISANGSPLAESSDIFISVPVGGGESIRLGARDLTKRNFLHLNAETQSIVRTLSVSLTEAAGGSR